MIRMANEADAGPISALLRRAFVEFEALYTPEAFVATVLPPEGVLQRMAEGPVWVAEQESSIIGTVAAVALTDSVLVRGMAVHPRARGFGIGKELLRRVEEFACQVNQQRVALFTTSFLTGAIALYESRGFRFTGETASPHGTALAGMVKVLESSSTRAVIPK